MTMNDSVIKVHNLGKRYKLGHLHTDYLYEKEFEISQFKDTFAEKLKHMIIEQKRGKVVSIKRKKSEQKEKNLMEALKASLK